MSILNLAGVEVRKNADSTTWYNAILQDIVGDRAVVSFEDGVWGDREVPCTSVRPRPHLADREISEATAHFGLYDWVEVQVAASGANPHGWSLCVITSSKGGCFCVRLGKAGSHELIVQPDSLRPVSQEQPLNPLELFRRAVPIDDALLDWLSSADARGCVDQVRSVAGLAHAGLGSDERGIFSAEAAGSLRPDAIILIGHEPSVRKGNLLLQVHMMHQREVEAFHERRRQKLQLLNDIKSKPSAAAETSFNVAPDLIGRTLGKGGENVKRAEKAHNVEIRVVDGYGECEDRIVRIMGETHEAVNKAVMELELFRVEYAVDEDKVGWILGKGHKDVQDIAHKTGLVYAPRLTEAGDALELCGLRHCVEDAQLLLDTQIEYFQVYQMMAQQNEEIDRSFEALESRAESVGLRPPGAGKGKRPASPQRTQRPASPQRSNDAAGRGGKTGGGRSGQAAGRGGGRGDARESGHAPVGAVEDVSPSAPAKAEDSADAPAKQMPSKGDKGRGRGGGGKGRQSQQSRPIGEASRPIGEGSSQGRSIWRAKNKAPED